MTTITAGRHTYEVVDKIPTGFSVWNIGKIEDYESYLPLYEPAEIGNHKVNVDTLKAIKLPKEEVALLLKSAGYGVASIKECKRCTKLRGKSYLSQKRKELAGKSLPLYERYTAH